MLSFVAWVLDISSLLWEGAVGGKEIKPPGPTAKAGRAEFIGILEGDLKDRGFCSDMQPLLRTDITYNPQAPGKYVKAHLLNLLSA